MSYAQQVPRLKVYLLRDEWTTNETFIFFKIQDMIKKYRDWCCIYQDRNEQWMKHSFSLKYKQRIENTKCFQKN